MDTPSNPPQNNAIATQGSSRASNSPLPTMADSRRGIPEFSDLLLACRHRLLLTCSLGTVVAIMLTVTAWSIIQPQFIAEGLVRVREKQNVIFAAQTTRSEDLAFFRSQGKLVQSPQVLAAALKKYLPSEFQGEVPSVDPQKWLAAQIRVETETGSEVMSIAASNESPQLAQGLANAVTEAYLAEIIHRLSSDRNERAKKLRHAAVQADQRLDELWNELNQVAQAVGSDNSESLTLRDEMQLQSYRDYAKQLQASQLRGVQLQAQLAEQRHRIKNQSEQPAESIDALLLQEPEVIVAESQLSELRLEIDQMRKIAAKSDSPQIERLTRQYSFLTHELEKQKTRLHSQIATHQQKSRQADEQDSDTGLLNQIELNRAEKEFLRSRLSEIAPLVSREAPKTAVPLDVSRHAVDRQSRLADGLWQALQELQIELKSQPRVTLLELARLPKRANHSRQLKVAGAAGLMGWISIVFLIGYSEWRDCRVRNPSDVVTRSRFPLFGTASYSDSSSMAGGHRDAPCGGVREAAARLLLRDHDDTQSPTLMVTSCTTSEPRHLISQELATLLSSFQRRVLLIDCDTDRSYLSALLGASYSSGMRQISVGERGASLDEIARLILTTDRDEVDFLPAGTIDRESSWIDPRTLRSVLNRVHDSYDAIIVNGPSMMGSVESLLLASEVDTTVFSVFTNRTRWNQLVLCEEMARDSGISIGGSILHSGKGRRGPGKFTLQSPVASTHKPFGHPSSLTDQLTDHNPEEQLSSEIQELQQEAQRAGNGTCQANVKRGIPTTPADLSSQTPPN